MEISKGFICQLVEFSRRVIGFDLSIPSGFLKSLEPFGEGFEFFSAQF